MSQQPIFLVSEPLLEGWSNRLVELGILLSKNGELRETEEGFHQMWDAVFDGSKIFWAEFFTQKAERRDLLVIGPPLEKKWRNLHAQSLAQLDELGALRLEGV